MPLETLTRTAPNGTTCRYNTRIATEWSQAPGFARALAELLQTAGVQRTAALKAAADLFFFCEPAQVADAGSPEYGSEAHNSPILGCEMVDLLIAHGVPPAEAFRQIGGLRQRDPKRLEDFYRWLHDEDEDELALEIPIAALQEADGSLPFAVQNLLDRAADTDAP